MNSHCLFLVDVIAVATSSELRIRRGHYSAGSIEMLKSSSCTQRKERTTELISAAQRIFHSEK